MKIRPYKSSASKASMAAFLRQRALPRFGIAQEGAKLLFGVEVFPGRRTTPWRSHRGSCCTRSTQRHHASPRLSSPITFPAPAGTLAASKAVFCRKHFAGTPEACCKVIATDCGCGFDFKSKTSDSRIAVRKASKNPLASHC